MKRIIYIVFIVDFCLIPQVICKNIPADSGPYYVDVKSVSKCEHPFKPYVGKDMKALNLEIEMYEKQKRQLLKGNVTILKTNIEYKSDITKMRMENGKLVTEYKVKNMSCHNYLIRKLFSLAAINFNKRTCVCKPGKYHFDGVDLNTVFHLVAPVRSYGKQYWQLEGHSRLGTDECILMQADFMPLKTEVSELA